MQPQPSNISKPEESTISVTSTPSESIHNLRPTATDDDNIIHASLQGHDIATEGRYRWILVSACCIVSFWVVGTLYSWGVMQAALVKEGISAPSTLAWIGSLGFTCIAVFAIINVWIINRIGARPTTFLGLTMLASGEIFSGFSTYHIGGLFFTAGILSGAGTSLCFLVINTIPSQYFQQKRGLANGIVCAGGGLGGTIITLSMDMIIEHVGPAWAFRILGLMTLATGLPAAYFIKPRYEMQLDKPVDWRLFRDMKFVIIFLVGVIATFPLLVPPFFIPLYSASLGYSSSAGAALLAGFNIASAIGRLAGGLAADFVGPLNTLIIGLFFTIITLFVIWPLSTSLGPLIAFVIINGASNGGFFATMPTVVGSLFGSQRMSIAMGMVVTGWAGGYLMGAPIAGYLLDSHGGQDSTLAAYRPIMWYAGSMALAALLLVTTVRLHVSRQFLRRV